MLLARQKPLLKPVARCQILTGYNKYFPIGVLGMCPIPPDGRGNAREPFPYAFTFFSFAEIGIIMQYRAFGRTGIKVSEISLGTEYLLDISQDQASSVIKSAVDSGINYFDLFWPQAHFRDKMGKAFDGLRDKVMLAAHLGSTLATDGQYEKTRDMERSNIFFDDFLKRYHTDFVDVLFLHNSDGQEDYDVIFKQNGFFDRAMALKKQGKARFIAFSGHTVSTCLQAVKSGKIDVLMFPINLASHSVEGKRELLAACASHNIALVVMKPFAGGKLLAESTEMDLVNWQSAGGEMKVRKNQPITPIQCLSYVLSQQGVSTVVPGCKTVDELKSCLKYFEASDLEKDFSSILTQFQQFRTGECVYCNHCLPCPANINIGEMSRFLDRGEAGLTKELRAAYQKVTPSAGDCLECGDCTSRCPFGVDVIPRMRRTVEIFR
jgi:uncharacterized protein